MKPARKFTVKHAIECSMLLYFRFLQLNCLTKNALRNNNKNDN